MAYDRGHFLTLFFKDPEIKSLMKQTALEKNISVSKLLLYAYFKWIRDEEKENEKDNN